MTRIMHMSDTHGVIRELEGDYDMVVHTGDLFPNWTRGIRAVEGPRQTQWIIENADLIASNWSKGKPLVYVPGNHDYCNPVPALRAAGVEAFILVDDMITIDGIKFYGHPWVPHFFGEWNFEIFEHEIASRLRPVAELIESGDIDVMLCHAPMWGARDKNGYGEHCGSASLMDMVYGLTRPLKALLHGHIHEDAGISFHHKTIISNAALTSRIIEL